MEETIRQRGGLCFAPPDTPVLPSSGTWPSWTDQRADRQAGLRRLVPPTAVLALSLVCMCVGCATPNVSSHSQVNPDQDIIAGGLSSNDVRTVAARMCPSILAVPEVSSSPEVVRIAISPMKNSSRFIMDMSIFMKKLRLELNRHSGGQVRFFSQRNAGATRNTVLANRREQNVGQALDELADALVGSPLVGAASEPLEVAVVPVLNTNFVNMNADSMTAMLRAKIAERAGGRVLFTMPGTKTGADYLLTGQFIAESMKREGIVNLADYIGLMEERMREGKSLDLCSPAGAAVSGVNSGNQVNIIGGVEAGMKPSLLSQLQTSARLRAEPNVTKRLNVMLVRTRDNLAVFERMFTIDRKQTDGTENASLILSGEITGMAKRRGGVQSDYVLITFQLVNPDNNELLWEDGYEVKRASLSGVVYQ